jgi:hypothetical protein
MNDNGYNETGNQDARRKAQGCDVRNSQGSRFHHRPNFLVRGAAEGWTRSRQLTIFCATHPPLAKRR